MKFTQKIIVFIFTLLLTYWGGKSLFAAPRYRSFRISEGTVRLQRRGWINFQKKGPGTTIYQGDLFIIPTDSTTRVFCSGDNYPTLAQPTGVELGVDRVCPPSNDDGPRGSDDDPILGGGDSSVPYIISPRRTFLHSNELTLRWNHVVGASRYTVSIISRDKGSLVKDWNVEVTDDKIHQSGTGYPQIEVNFPEDLPIEQGDDDIYLVVVISDTEQSSQQECAFTLEKCLDTPKYELPQEVDSFFAYTSEETAGWGFRIPLKEEMKTFQEQLDELNEKIDADQLQGTPLSDETKALSFARLYEKHELFYEAINVLRDLVKSGKGTIAIHDELGRLYGNIGLNLLAIESYSKALELAQAAEDVELENQALAQLKLAQVYLVMGKSPESTSHLEQAKQICQHLNENIDNVTSELPISKQCGNLPEQEKLLARLSIGEKP